MTTTQAPEVPFVEAIRTETDKYLRNYMKNARKDSITMMHKGLVKAELQRRAAKSDPWATWGGDGVGP